MYKLLKNVVFVLLLLYTLPTFSQEKDSLLYMRDADELLVDKPTSYQLINTTLKKHSNDSVKTRFFIDYFVKNAYLSGESYALNELGIYCRNTSQYEAAIQYHEKALEKAILANNTELRVISLNMLGVVYRRKDITRTALDYHYDALTLAERVKNPSESIRKSIAVSLNSMGNLYLSIGQYDLAVEKFSKSLAIEQSVGNTLGLAINYGNIGYAKEATGDLEGALADYKTSLKYNKAVNSTLGEVICNNSIGQIFIKQGKFKEGLETILPSLDAAKGLRDKFHLTGIYNNIGWAYSELKQYKSARKYLNEGLRVAKEENFKSSMVEAYTHLSTLSERENKYKESLAFFREAEKIDDEIAEENNFKYVNDLIIKYDTEKINTENQLLEKENETVRSKLLRNKYIWTISCVLLALIAFIIHTVYRQRLLKNEKKILTLEQDMLRSQMNPHFVFNSLNSIKQYIISNEQKNAVHYLNKFAKLIRKILDASRVKEVSLADELETMDLYMSIENIRFSNEISFEIFVDDTINLNDVKVPSLVLQPFLENALWHGLSSKKGQKNIKLSVEHHNNDFVTISIEDNGIGREQARIIANKKIVKRKSIGITLTKNRLANFVKDFKNTFSLSFKDLKDQNNNPLGTQVILQLPVK